VNIRLVVVSSSLSIAIWSSSVFAQTTEDPRSLTGWFVYIGTYTTNDSQGIYVSRMDLSSGKLTPAVLAAKTANPSFLAAHPSRRYLYSVNELSRFEGQDSGAVSAWAINRPAGVLQCLNQRPSGGPGPCHLTVNKSGSSVLVANYGGGSVGSVAINEDGSLGRMTSFHQHQGSSVDPRRQEGPHAHSINLDRENRFAMVADLGLDRILVYQFERAMGNLVPGPPFAEPRVTPGAGPRHGCFHPNGNYAYVIHELDSTVTAFRYDADEGALESLQTVATLPDAFEGENHTAEVAIHPNGKFLYGSNRGHDSIAVFAIDLASGKMTLVQVESTRGKTPRNFAIDPSGSYLLAANQGSDAIVVFRVDPATGRLATTDERLPVPTPVCVTFVPGDVH
jgi:6-phosphogluconolactonase